MMPKRKKTRSVWDVVLETYGESKLDRTEDKWRSTIREKRTLVDAIRASRWKMVGNALRHLEEMHNVILEGMREVKKTARRPRNSYVGQIKCDAKVKTF